MHHRFLSGVAKQPWCIAQCDIDANLAALAAGPKPTGPTTQKIWKLLKLGGSHLQIVKDGLDLLMDCPWGTACTEQGHAMTACVKRVHRELGLDALASWAGVAGCRKLVPSVTRGEKALAKLEDKLEQLDNHRRGIIIGRNIPLAI